MLYYCRYSLLFFQEKRTVPVLYCFITRAHVYCIAGAIVSSAHFYFTYFLKFSNEFLRLQVPVSSHNSWCWMKICSLYVEKFPLLI
jgi:hypothetical protein